jgi:hypothetical protein
LLKHIEVIGARGKNWPISDGIDQIRLIASCDEAASKASNPATITAAPKAKNADGIPITSRAPRANGNNNNVTRDPHASLSLFGGRENDTDSSYDKAAAPKASARPPPRDYHDLFVGGDSDRSTNVTPQKKHVQQPKATVDRSNAPKAGGGKSYQPSRIFDDDQEDANTLPNPKTGGLMTNSKKYNHFDLGEDANTPPNPKTGGLMTNSKKYNHFDLGEGGNAPDPSPYKTSPKKYNHFEFGDGSDPADVPKPQAISTAAAKPSKHASQWEFEDFTTPAKPTSKVRGQDVRHFGWSYSDDEKPQESPVQSRRHPQARPDSDTHFEFQDDGTPEGDQRPAGLPRGTTHNNGLGLYSNNLYDEDGNAPAEEAPKQPLSNVTTNMKAHSKVFDSQFSMTDESPSSKGTKDAQAVPENQKKVVNMMNANWDMLDQPASDNKKENTRIKTTGDGLGGRRGTTTRTWGIGNESDGEEAGGVNGSEFQKGVRSKGGRHGQVDDHWEF